MAASTVRRSPSFLANTFLATQITVRPISPVPGPPIGPFPDPGLARRHRRAPFAARKARRASSGLQTRSALCPAKLAGWHALCVGRDEIRSGSQQGDLVVTVGYDLTPVLSPVWEVTILQRRFYMSNTITKLPLEGIKVIDFTGVQAGPACCQMLAWFGADVLKVERTGVGDVTRRQLRDIPDVDALYFTQLNSNKRSLELNTKTPEGKAIMEQLIRKAERRT